MMEVNLNALIISLTLTVLLVLPTPGIGQQSNRNEPGVTDAKITLGVLIPVQGPLASSGSSMNSALHAYFDEVNSTGGINGRRIEIREVHTGETSEQTVANLEVMLRDTPLFGLVSPMMAGAERPMVTFAQQRNVPIVGPSTLYPQVGNPPVRQIFYTLSGIDDQLRVLVEFSTTKPNLKGKKTGIVTTGAAMTDVNVSAIQDQLKKNNLPGAEVVAWKVETNITELVQQLMSSKCEQVFFLGMADQSSNFFKEAERLKWFPAVLMPGVFGDVRSSLPSGFTEKVFLAFPTTPADLTSEGKKEFQFLTEKYKYSADHPAAQLSALAAAKIFTEGLRRAGKDLTREKLIQSLETLKDFSTGVTRPITYSETVRIGAHGAYIIGVNATNQFVQVSDWISIN